MGSGRGLGRNGGPMMHRQGGSAAVAPPCRAKALDTGSAWDHGGRARF